MKRIVRKNSRQENNPLLIANGLKGLHGLENAVRISKHMAQLSKEIRSIDDVPGLGEEVTIVEQEEKGKKTMRFVTNVPKRDKRLVQNSILWANVFSNLNNQMKKIQAARPTKENK